MKLNSKVREFNSGERCRSCSSYGKPVPSCKSEPSIYCHSPSPLKGPSCPQAERCCCGDPYTPCLTDPTRGYASDQFPAMLRWAMEAAHQPQCNHMNEEWGFHKKKQMVVHGVAKTIKIKI